MTKKSYLSDANSIPTIIVLSLLNPLIIFGLNILTSFVLLCLVAWRDPELEEKDSSVIFVFAQLIFEGRDTTGVFSSNRSIRFDLS